MARYAIGDVQGCYDELRALTDKLRFNSDRDQLWFVGDLVNRGPKSLEVLRWVKSLGQAAVTVLGNHDLHLLAIGLGTGKSASPGDTLDAVLGATDSDQLLAWLIERPLLVCDNATGAGARLNVLVHAGILPLWTTQQAAALAHEVEAALRSDPKGFLASLYGNLPDQWNDGLTGTDRLRFAVNVLTRMRFCTTDGRIDLKLKGPPDASHAPWLPWFAIEPRAPRAERIVCGHWSALGLHRQNAIAALDTGCIWGESLTAIDLDAETAPIFVSCRARAAH